MMRIIKLALISFITLFLIVTAISLLIPSHIRISRAINIKEKSDIILSLITDQRRWPQWHPAFIHNDANFRNTAITPLRQNDSEFVVQLQQAPHRPVVSGWQVHTTPAADSVTLQWYMDFNLPWYPWQKFSSLLYEKTYGSMMEQGLANIKRKAEKEVGGKG